MEKLTKICEQCGVVFDKPYYLSKTNWLKRKYCTMQCSLINTGIKLGEPLPVKWVEKMKGRPSPKKGIPSQVSGDKHYNWKGGMVAKYCQVCSTPFEVIPKRKDTAKFCSQKCKHIAQDSGISTENEKIRRSKQYREWRKLVYERDNYTCVECGKHGGQLNADHIKPFAFYPDDRFKLENGKTLCLDCHKNTPTYGLKVFAYIQEQYGNL